MIIPPQVVELLEWHLTARQRIDNRQHLRSTAATTVAIGLAGYSLRANKQQYFVVARVARNKQLKQASDSHDEKRTSDIGDGSSAGTHDERSDSLRACFHVENLAATSFASTNNSNLQGDISERQTSSARQGLWRDAQACEAAEAFRR